MRRIREVAVVIGTLMSVAGLVPPACADWPNFRGVRHDGISDETGLRTTWTEPLQMAWEREVGSGYSSFACVGDRVYTCGTEGKEQVLLCLNAQTGAVIYRTPIEGEYKDSQGDGPRATPTVDGGRVYILGAHGRLLCANASDGTEVWSRQFDNRPKWGYSGSVLLEGDLAVVSAGESGGALAAFNKKTGEPVWTCGEDAAGYATPYPFTYNDRRYIVGFTADSAVIADAKTGKEVWRTAWKTDWDVNASSPIFHDGHLFLTSGYRTGSALFKLSSASEELSTEPVWKSKVVMNKFQSCILHEGNLYTSDQKALKCVEFMTGQERWRVNRVKHGTLVLADRHLYLLTEKGQLQIGRASPEGFSAMTTANILGGRCWTVPVLHQGRLYARNLLGRVVCFNLKP